MQLTVDYPISPQITDVNLHVQLIFKFPFLLHSHVNHPILFASITYKVQTLNYVQSMDNHPYSYPILSMINFPWDILNATPNSFSVGQFFGMDLFPDQLETSSPPYIWYLVASCVTDSEHIIQLPYQGWNILGMTTCTTHHHIPSYTPYFFCHHLIFHILV